MKIGIYDPYLDDLGGGEKYMMTIAQTLSKENEVDVFWENANDIKELLKRFSLDLSKIKLVSNIFSPKVSTIRRFLITRKYDFIIFLSDGSIPLVSSKLLVHIQQPLDQMQTDSILGKFKTRRVRTFFCNSKYTKSFIDRKFDVKTIVLYPPVKLQPKKVEKENVILHVGRFRVKNVKNDDYKKQRLMISEFKKMVDDGLKDWRFILAVSVAEKDGKAFEEMKRSAQNFPIEFLVNKSNDQLWETYSRARIYWHATGYGENLEEHPEFAEHFGISTVEAMGAGVVPVVINAGGQTEIVNDGGNGFLWNNFEELEEKTLRLINNKKLLESMSKAAKKRSIDFSEENFSEKVNGFIK